jgi:hypothetical protein
VKREATLTDSIVNNLRIVVIDEKKKKEERKSWTNPKWSKL